MLDNLFIERDPQTIFWMPIVIVAIFLVRGVATYVTDYGMATSAAAWCSSCASRCSHRYLRLPSAFFDREPSGQQISRITYTVRAGRAGEHRCAEDRWSLRRR